MSVGIGGGEEWELPICVLRKPGQVRDLCYFSTRKVFEKNMYTANLLEAKHSRRQWHTMVDKAHIAFPCF